MRVSKGLNYTAAMVWGGMLGLRLRQVVQGDPLAFLLALQAAIVAWRLVVRRPPAGEAAWGWRAFAWASALLPLAALPGGTPVLPVWMAAGVGSAGLVLALWALWSLGTAFGVAPADRGLVTRGPYRWLRHPAYAGELANFLAYLVANLRWWNLVLTGLLVATIAVRIRLEEDLIRGYRKYSRTVRWRLVPGVW